MKFSIAPCSSPARTGLRRPLALACKLVLCALWGQGAAGERDACDAATPLRVVNLDPFHLVYGVPVSYGACVLQPGGSELIASLDIASHMNGAKSGSEGLSIDGETYRQALALRHGFGRRLGGRARTLRRFACAGRVRRVHRELAFLFPPAPGRPRHRAPRPARDPLRQRRQGPCRCDRRVPRSAISPSGSATR